MQELVQDETALIKCMVDHVPTMLAYFDAELRCRFANRAYAQAFGLVPQATVGQTMQTLLGPEAYAKRGPHAHEALRGLAQSFEHTLDGPQGRQHLRVNYIPDRPDGVVQGFAVEITDITLQREAEMALLNSEQQFRTLSESSPLGVFLADVAGRRTYTNARWQHIYGMSGAEGHGEGWTRALHPGDRERVMSAWREMAARGSELELEFRVCHADGQVRRVRTWTRPICDQTGDVRGFVGVLEDMTDRRLNEDRLRASEEFLDRTGRIAGVGGWEVDLLTREVTWSAHTRRIHEVGDDFRPSFLDSSQAFYPAQAWRTLTAAVEESIRSGQGWDLELPFITARGRHLWVRVVGEVERDGETPIRLAGAFQDITESRQRQAELRREQELRQESERHAAELNRLSRERGEMLDILAHEVRQPLNNASAALQSAQSALADLPEQGVSGRLVRAQAVLGQVLASIDNTLAVASLLARPDGLRLVDTDIDMLLEVTSADMPSEQRDRITVERMTGTRTAAMDMSLMRLALRNLLSNALRYTPAGAPVRVCISDSDDPLAVVIDIADAGLGVPADRLARLFERGGKRVTTPSAHGLGLGLYIVRRVMELHGGSAELLRNGPDGATFRLVITQPTGD